ncbi:MAG: hypothetical protein R3F59_29665 [Myxococcota bacterium]
MSAPSLDLDPVIDGIVGRTVPMPVNVLSAVMIVIGIAAFGIGLATDGVVAWGAYLVGLLYTLGIAQGGVLFAVIQTGTWGRWGRPVKRIAETFGFFLPIGYLLLLVFLLFGLKIYAWNPDTIVEGGPIALHPHSLAAYATKEFWFQKWYFVGRQVVGLGILITLDFVYLRASLVPDLILASKRLGNRAPAWWARLTGGKTDLEGELRAGLHRQSFLVPFIAVAYALVFSFMAFDLIMSLSPLWMSNMFGAWTFVSAFWLSLAALGLTAMVARDWLRVGDFVRPFVTHDIGKLMLAGCMFWAYTGFAQLLPIWYTDMPEETDYLLVRMALPEWTWLAQTVAILCFLAPFTILLSRGIKKMRWPFVGVCSVVMIGMFLERTLLVLPSVYHGDPRTLMVWVVCVGTWLGFVGLLMQVVARALASVPPLVISDPHLEPHPWDVHVHAVDAAH